MARDYTRSDLQAALNRQTQVQQSPEFLRAKIDSLEDQLRWAKTQIADQNRYVVHLRKQIWDEQQTHNELHRALQERKDFDQWLKDVYPEVIAQYKAAMDLVEFMEDDPTKPNPNFFPNYYPSRGGKSILMQQYQSIYELEKVKLEAEKLKEGK